MQFTRGASVFTADGKEAGHVDRVVLNPKTKEVTHIVVRKGVFFAEDKVLPIDLLASADEHRVTLRADVEDLERQPDFQETEYVLVDEEELKHDRVQSPLPPPSLYWYPPYTAGPIMSYSAPAYVAETKENIPEDTVALKEGAKVITADGKHVGNVERVLTDRQSDRATHFLISEGILLKEKKLVPITWVDEVGTDQVRLTVGVRTLNELDDYADRN